MDVQFVRGPNVFSNTSEGLSRVRTPSSREGSRSQTPEEPSTSEKTERKGGRGIEGVQKGGRQRESTGRASSRRAQRSLFVRMAPRVM